MQVTHDDLLIETDFVMADGVFVKHFHFLAQEVTIGQHAHAHDHSSFVACGSVRIVKGAPEDAHFEINDYIAPAHVWIERGIKHTIVALREGTVFLCIHNTHGKDFPEIEDRATLADLDRLKAGLDNI